MFRLEIKSSSDLCQATTGELIIFHDQIYRHKDFVQRPSRIQGSDRASMTNDVIISGASMVQNVTAIENERTSSNGKSFLPFLSIYRN